MTDAPEEAAFLDALKANPADDTTRLVYADWLDEHNEQRKAEYLREVTGLAERQNDIDHSSPQVARIRELGTVLPAEWKAAAAGRFDVVLQNYSDKVRAIKRVRDYFQVGLVSAKGIVECAPNRLIVCTSLDSAVVVRDHLALSSGMELIVRGSEYLGDPPAALFQVLAEYAIFEGDFDPDEWGRDPQRDEEARSSFVRFVAAALETHQDDAHAKVEAMAFMPADRGSAFCFILAADIPLLEAQRLASRCASFSTLDRRFEVGCYITGRVHPNT